MTERSSTRTPIRPLRWFILFVVMAVVSTSAAYWWTRSPGEHVDPPIQSTKTTPAASTISTAQVPLIESSWDRLDDPRADGWDTEAFHDQAKKQLERIGEWLVEPQEMDQPAVGSLVTTEFSCHELVPRSLERVTSDSTFLVERGVGLRDKSEESDRLSRGIAGFTEAIERVATEFADARQRRAAFKVYRVEPSSNGVTTQQLLSVSGITDRGAIEHHATWSIDWDSSTPPKIEQIAVSRFERVRTRHAGGPLFADCTDAVLARTIPTMISSRLD